tara:strand:- start:285 stop:500 length:216 start_codon:yes stop_codon:yes gene_type:complete
MEKPYYFQYNPVFNNYIDNTIPTSLVDEPFLDVFTYEIRWRKKIEPSKIYLDYKKDRDYTNINNWPEEVKK